MPADDRRHTEVAQVLDKIVTWASRRPDVKAVAVVGSWARETARMNSDLDIVVLTDDLEDYLTKDGWAAELADTTVVATVQDGALTERRLVTRSGLEVEVGFATPRWASEPVDRGSARVVADGLRPILDPHGLLARLLDAVVGSARAGRPPRA
jgi:predicted nucleotidyltransferase